MELALALPGPATRIVAGRNNSCARLADRRWFCWGGNLDGQIGPLLRARHLAPSELDLTKVHMHVP